MSTLSDSDTETEVVSRNLCGIVDIGSNGIRFSISSKAAHHARIMPCVFKDRVGLSLYEVQYNTHTNAKCPIPRDIIKEVCSAMKRFKLICDDFGVPETSVRVIATEATRDAINADEFVNAVYGSTGWKVEILGQEDETRVGIYGVVSSFNTVRGLYLDVAGGSTQLSWVISSHGEVKQSSKPVSLPYGAGTLLRRMRTDDNRALFYEIKEAYKDAIEKIGIPQEMIDDAKKEGGFDLWTRGGGLRGMGHLLLYQSEGYPIQTIINGYACTYEEFSSMSDYLFLKQKIPGSSKEHKIFKVSDRRALQLPAVGLFMSAVFEAIPQIKAVHFSEGGVREGSLYSLLPKEIRAQDPLLIASRPYAPLLTEKYLYLLRTSIPQEDIPEIVNERIAPALCNLAFVHASYPKELQPTAALHVATRGIIAGCHGLSHRARALIGIALCSRWGGNIPESEEKYSQELEQVVLREGDKAEALRIVWWTKYIGTIMYVICGVHPGGNIRDNVFDFHVSKRSEVETSLKELIIDDANTTKVKEESTRKNRGYEVIVRISKDDLKTSASVRSRIITLQKKVRKLSRGSVERVKIGVQFYEE
ncbi:CRB_1a_G0017880.mRNA.1.CDS.1 [Saccharomyces cerevisiae]|nr:CRB_1a_G0017880.mRNA.1.CDS.1 [Saccharomyces cerevisiae]CAI7282707.1 CRB_1a_G0017880.mRNA.1.CDS.1 [Saccharomyces cerevisiae]